MFNEQEQFNFTDKEEKVQFSDISEDACSTESADMNDKSESHSDDDYDNGNVFEQNHTSPVQELKYEEEKYRDIRSVEDEFIFRLKHLIHRDGIDELIDFIKTSGFLTAPASTKYHGAYEGGLLQHSLNVHDVMRKELDMTFGNEWKMFLSEESVAIVSLLHDLCKTDMYIQQMRNVKVNGEWTQELYYAYNQEQFSMGHSAKTIHMIQRFIKLTDDEAQAIYWHMGAFDLSQYSTAQGMGNAYTNNLLAFFLHLADMKATYINENDKFWEHYREIQKMKAPADRT